MLLQDGPQCSEPGHVLVDEDGSPLAADVQDDGLPAPGLLGKPVLVLPGPPQQGHLAKLKVLFGFQKILLNLHIS